MFSSILHRIEQGSTDDISIEKLGKQMTQLIMEADYPLDFTAALTSRFPLVVRNVSQVKVEGGLNRALEVQDGMIAPGDEFLLVNGVSVRSLLAFSYQRIVHCTQ